MPTRNEVKQIIQTFLEELNPNKNLSTLSEHENLLEAELLASLDFVILIQMLQEKTGIEIDFTKIDPSMLITLEGLLQHFAQK